MFAGTDYRRRVHEAMTMAIEALERLDKVCCEHDAAMKQFIADAYSMRDKKTIKSHSPEISSFYGIKSYVDRK